MGSSIIGFYWYNQVIIIPFIISKNIWLIWIIQNHLFRKTIIFLYVYKIHIFPYGRDSIILLIDQAGSQTNLVAVRGIAGGSGGYQLTLGQLTGHGIGNGNEGISRTGNAHGLIDIRTAGQRIADRAAQAGGSTAEGLDLGGMVMGLVLEHEQPGLLNAVNVDVNLDGAGIDLFALVEVGQLAGLLQVLAAHGGNVHQVDGLLADTLAVHGFAGSQIALEGSVVSNFATP